MSKKKRKRYTKKELAKARLAGNGAIFHELAVNLLKGIKMSIAETESAVNLVGNSRPEGSISKVNLAAIPEAQNALFIYLYHSYHGDLEGKHGITKFSGEAGPIDRVVGIEEKKEDVIRLNEHHADWTKKSSTNKHQDQILNLVINEVNNDLKAIDELYRSGEIDKGEADYRRKGTILRSKYLYIRVTGVFEELDEKEVLVNFNGMAIEITRWSMVHILNRHYAQAAKHYESGKSFHQDPSLRFFEDPEQLKEILESVAPYHKMNRNGIKFIPFKLNSQIYSVYTENKVKGNKVPFVQLQTFYPTEDNSELRRIRWAYVEIQITSNLSAYSKKWYMSLVLFRLFKFLTSKGNSLFLE